MLVYFFNSFEHSHFVAVFFGGLNQRLHIFRETASAIAAAGIEELGADAGVGTDAFTHHVDVGADEFAKVGNVVHERDSCRQHGVCCIFDHFSRGDVGEDDAEIVEQEGAVEAAHNLAGLFAFNAYDHPVGAHEVFDGGAFFEEFGV